MQIMLRLCDKFANDFDIKFNCGKSVAMRIEKRFKEKCVPLKIDNKDILYCMLLNLNIWVFISVLDSF